MIRTRTTIPDAAISSAGRRRVLQGLGLLGVAPWLARAEADTGSAASPLRLPLHLEQLVNHIGTSVPDVTRSATFYSRLFDGGRLLGQTKPALRYEIDFHPGALSIGPLRTAVGGERAHPFIDHFCVAARPFNGPAWRARLDAEKVGHFANGTFVDIGGISVQLIGSREPGAARKGPPGGGFAPMPPLYTGEPLVRPHGFDHLMLHVADLDASIARFRELFGLTPHEASSGRKYFQIGAIRLGLQQAGQGEKPVIAAFAIRVSPFDHERITHELEALGAKIEPVEAGGRQTVLRFADPDGIHCELRSV